jgi:carboxylesterase type B
MKALLTILLAATAFAQTLPSLLQYKTWTPKDAKDPLVVNTESGPVKGYYSHLTYRGSSNDLFKANTARGFLGIPFAAPPTKENRFRDPQPYATPWKGKVRYAKVNAPSCPQKWKSIQSEDCLFLNIFTPPIERIKKAGGKLPVMFWVYGGGFTIGSSKQFSIYDGRYMAQKHDAIIVTSNYRLGVLGFLAAPGQKEDVRGNFGIKDQIAALEWTYRNIGNFGGNPDRITIFGQSAGATSVLIHLVSPAVKPKLVHAAIAMSPPMEAYTRSHAEMQQIGLDWAKNVSCIAADKGMPVANMDCLRQLSTKDILASQTSPYNTSRPVGDVDYWWPHVDGHVLTADLFRTLERGKMKKVPLTMGWMKDEGGWSTMEAHTPIVRAFKDGHKAFQYKTIVSTIQHAFRNKSPAIMKQFPFSETDVEVNERSFVDVVSQYMFQCTTHYIAQKLAHYGHNVRLYDFRRVQKTLLVGRCFQDMACHSFELWYLWRPFWDQINAKEQAFSDTFIDYFVGFAQDKRFRTWPQFQPTTSSIMVMDKGFALSSSAYMRQKCAFWEKEIGYYTY